MGRHTTNLKQILKKKKNKEKRTKKVEVWPDGRTTNEKGSRKENKINNFWFCFHSFFREKKG